MTVAELIMKLQEVPQDCIVNIWEAESYTYEDLADIERMGNYVFLMTQADKDER